MTFEIRPPTDADFDAYYSLYRTQTIEEFGSCAMPAEEVRQELFAPGYVWEKMMLLAEERETHSIVGYVEVRAFHTPPVRPYCYGYVHPDVRGRGLGTRLVTEADRLADRLVNECPPDARVVLQAFSMATDGRSLLADRGYSETRESHIMQIDFDGAPQEPIWPEGFAVRSLENGVPLVSLLQTVQACFRDHRGSVDEPIEAVVERWEHLITSNKSVYDPSLFCLLEHNGTPVGEIIMWTGSEEDDQKAFVQSLGVLPAYRRRGLGKSLLQYGFSRAFELGKHSVSLNVDASSLTGADRLYRSAGMYPFRVFTAFERELRPGTEISNQG